ncbi:NAD(P)-binding protein [Aspergillus californicus]
MFGTFGTATIPPGSLILVTGANGYIASHVINQLLQLRYNVIGTVREEKPWLDRYFWQLYGKNRYRSVVLSDLGNAKELGQALENVAGIIHVASDVSMNANPEQVIPQTVRNTLNVLEAASKQKSVQRVVLTSSTLAAMSATTSSSRVVIDDDCWNDVAVDMAFDPRTPVEDRSYAVYAASKAEGERQAWRWVGEHQPQFTFNTVLPFMNFGKILLPEISGSTMNFPRSLLRGDPNALKMGPQWFVNVEDTARLHVVALLAPEVKSERIWACAKPMNWTGIVARLRELRPLNSSIPEPPENEGEENSDITGSKRAEGYLKRFFNRSGWATLEESLRDGIMDLA